MNVAAQRVLVSGAVVVVIAIAVGFRSRILGPSHATKSPTASADAATKHRVEVHVPHVTEPLELNGELTEKPWHNTPVTKFLQPDGTESRPYNDIRFLWSSAKNHEGILHVGLYASDLNIVSAGAKEDGPVWLGDSFHVVFSPPRGESGAEHSFYVGTTADGGVLADAERVNHGDWSYAWQSGARLKIDMDKAPSTTKSSRTRSGWSRWRSRSPRSGSSRRRASTST